MRTEKEAAFEIASNEDYKLLPDENEQNENYIDKNKEVKVTATTTTTTAAATTTTNPVSNSTQQKLMLVTASIISCEFCERLSYYGLASSLQLYFKTYLNLSSAESASYLSIWTGVCYATPLLGGYIADDCLGRFKCILIFVIIYWIGLSLISSSTFTENSSVIFWLGLYFVALGTGGIKPNVSTLGAEQFDSDNNNNNNSEKQKESFFNWFYFSINVGALIAYTIVAYLCQEVSFKIGYIIPPIALLIGIMFYISSSKYYYISKRENNSMLLRFISIIGLSLYRLPEKINDDITWLDMSKAKYGGKHESAHVEDVKNVIKVLPFLGYYVMYWLIYAQQSTLFYIQGCQMNIKFAGVEIPISSLSLFNTLVMIITIPIMDYYLLPYLRNKLHYDIPMLKKINFGFIIISLALVYSAIIEVIRKNVSIIDNEYSVCDDDNNIPVSNISILWQIPAYILVGLSEIFSIITGLEFFFSQAPKNMKSLLQSLNLCTTALGSWLNSAFLAAFASWIPNNLNHGHLEWFYLILVGCMLINSFFFVRSSRTYKYINVNHDEIIEEVSKNDSKNNNGDNSNNNNNNNNDYSNDINTNGDNSNTNDNNSVVSKRSTADIEKIKQQQRTSRIRSISMAAEMN